MLKNKLYPFILLVINMDKSEKPNIEEIWKEILEREPWVLDDLKKNIEILKRNPLLFEKIKKEILERERERSNLLKYLN